MCQSSEVHLVGTFNESGHNFFSNPLVYFLNTPVIFQLQEVVWFFPECDSIALCCSHARSEVNYDENVSRSQNPPDLDSSKYNM